MKKISSRSPEVARKIRDREPFQTYGALRAEVIETPRRLSVWDSGRLSGEDMERFRDECQIIRYVVWSYSTPIAWWAGYVPDEANVPGEHDGWYVVKAKFSRTTSAHQGKLYLVPRHLPVPDWDCETEAYSLSDCRHWGTPGSDCSGPRVGVTPDGVILCEGHFNAVLP